MNKILMHCWKILIISNKNQTLPIFQMFDSMTLNKLDICCQLHPRTKISSICIDNSCQSGPLLCYYCVADNNLKSKHLYHEQNIKSLWDGVAELALEVQKSRPIMDRLYKQIAEKKENVQLVRQEYERHTGSFQNHINSLKYQIDEQVKSIYRIFQTTIEEARQQAFKQLDKHYRTYKENFDIFSKLIQPIMAFNTNHKYYSNFNNIAFKLFSQSPTNAADWLIDLKNTVTFTHKVSTNPTSFQELLERATTYMNAMIDSLPMNDFSEQKAVGNIRSVVFDLIKNSLHISDVKSLNLIFSTISQVPVLTYQGNRQPLGIISDDRRNGGGKKIFDDKALIKKHSR